MKTISWVKTATIDGVEWELDLAKERLILWRDRVPVQTVYSDSIDIILDTDSWPVEIVEAWQDMIDVMKNEATQ